MWKIDDKCCNSIAILFNFVYSSDYFQVFQRTLNQLSIPLYKQICLWLLPLIKSIQSQKTVSHNLGLLLNKILSKT